MVVIIVFEAVILKRVDKTIFSKASIRVIIVFNDDFQVVSLLKSVRMLFRLFFKVIVIVTFFLLLFFGFFKLLMFFMFFFNMILIGPTLNLQKYEQLLRHIQSLSNEFIMIRKLDILCS